VFNGTTSWSTREALLSYESDEVSSAELDVTFPDVDWQWLRDTYGWAALQWQAWARGEIYIQHENVDVLILNTGGVLEYWIDDQHYFGGDFYGFRKVPVTLRLSQGVHRFDVKLVREIRSMGGVGDPDVKVNLELRRSRRGLVRTNPEFDEGVLISDLIGGDYGPLASGYASVMVRNDAGHDIYVTGIYGMRNECVLDLLSTSPLKLVPGQTRPIAFGVGCVKTYDRRLDAELVYRFEGTTVEHTLHLGVWPDAYESMHEPHKVTYIGPGGTVSYAILKPPSPSAQCENDARNQSLPILIALHGAGVETDSEVIRSTLDDLPDLCAWALFPSGGTSWSGDDWHVWGLADVEAAVGMIPKWIEHVEWSGSGVDVDRWLVTGHSNGGQGTWYILTHRPDKVIAAAAVSGYSSIQNYVPYVSWHTSDPGREAVIQAALLNYRHELLLENAQDIPVLQQHGSKDDNVPVYNSRLLAQRIQQAGADSTFFEVPGQGHYWDGVMTTEPLSNFFSKHLTAHNLTDARTPLNLREFTMVAASTGDMGTKNGAEIIALAAPGKLAKLHFLLDPLTLTCIWNAVNVRSFRFGPNIYDDCQYILVNGQTMSHPTASQVDAVYERTTSGWQLVESLQDEQHEKYGHQLGGMNAILRSIGPFSIVQHSANTQQVALQISRNLCQYYAADTDITSDYSEALNSTGNVISIAIGQDLPQSRDEYPIFVHGRSVINGGSVILHADGLDHGWFDQDYPGLAAAYLRPLQGKRLELVVWGIDADALKTAARLVPMLTGSGQPDFIIMDRTMLWKGLEGTLALGFFDSNWEVSKNSYLAV